MKPTRASLQVKRLEGPKPIEARQYRAVPDLPANALSYSLMEYNGLEWRLVAGPMKQELAERIARALNAQKGIPTRKIGANIDG